MKSLSNTAPGQARSFNGGDAVRSGLPILGTGVLVWVLSGGFPPTTWVFLFQTLSQLNWLLATQGIGAIVPLTILIVQSLFLAAAWGLLGWIILREGAYLVTMQSRAELDRLLASQSSTDDELINPSQILQLPEQGFDMTTDQLENGHVLDPTTEQLEKEQNFHMTTGPLRRGKDFSVMASPLRGKEPEKEVSWPSRSMQLPMPSMQSSSINSRNIQPSRAESRNVQLASVESRHGRSRNAQPASGQSRHGQSRNVQPASGQSRHGQSRNVQPAIVESRHGQSRNVQPASVESRSLQSRNVQPASVQSQRASHLRQGLSARNLRKEDLLENPFDKEELQTSEPPVNGRRGRIEKVVEEEVELEEENEEDDSPFVFGNPFDGPLPEVFKYDADLRRSVPELAEEGKTGGNGSKAKKK